VNGSEKLYRALSDVRPELVESALDFVPARRSRRRLAALAACVCLVAAGAFALVKSGVFRRAQTAGAGGGGDAGGSEAYFFYAGPVFPLTLETQNAAVTAARNLAFDFSPYLSEENSDAYHAAAVVSDGYTLTNASDSAVTVRALYPFVSSLRDLDAEIPAVSVDGTAAAAALRQGAYSGGYTGGGDSAGSCNLSLPVSWEDYKALLADGSYERRALSDAAAADTPAIVYEFTDFTAPASGAQAPTLAVSFSLDPEKTTVLSWNFNGMERSDAGDRQRYSKSVSPGGSDGETACLIVLGDDIGPYAVQGYADGGCEPGGELSGVGAKVSRRETTLGALWLELAERSWPSLAVIYGGEKPANTTDAMLARAIGELAADSGPLSETPAERYGWYLNDLVSDAYAEPRVFYLSFDATIPAGGSVNVSARMRRRASYYFSGGNAKNGGVQGCDAVTKLGTNLTFTGLTASVDTRGAVEIVRQNFGFDPKKTVSQSVLDPDVEHYFLEVRKIR